MCGIAGVFSLNNQPISEGTLMDMLSVLRHRGPDDKGFFIHLDNKAGIGATRLSIIDLSPNGHQPMSNETQKLWVVHNGEIYNYQELRKSLQEKGHTFKSNTDTEVLLHGYEEWGIEGLLRKIRGMFASAISDGETLFIIRDPLGIKPVYTYHDSRVFLFASEIKSLLASNLIPGDFNPFSLVRFLQFGSVPYPLTIIKNVEMLPPGSYLSLHNGNVRVHNYWNLNIPQTSDTDSKERLFQLLEESVKMRLISERPLGLFLSGGIDSSIITGLVRKNLQGYLKTFSIRFQEDKFDEGGYAKEVSKIFETDHTEEIITPDEVNKEWDKILYFIDQPSIDGINTYFVSRLTRRNGVVVALSGLGGDELFGGYPSFTLIPRLQRLRKVPLFMYFLPVFKPFIKDSQFSRIKQFLKSHNTLENAYITVRSLFTVEEIKKILVSDLFELNKLPPFDGPKFLSILIDRSATLGKEEVKNPLPVSCHISVLELRNYMHNQLLRDTDMMSMAHSLEVRVPFLDHRLVEYSISLPEHYRNKKQILKDYLSEMAGPTISPWLRPKAGFTFPIDEWLRGALHDKIQDILFQKSPLFNFRTIQILWESFNKRQTHWSRVFSIAVLKDWMSRWKVQT